jgi:predicted thioesterase
VEAAAGLLGPGQTSVGTRVEIEHLAPSAVGSGVSVTADVAHRDGRLLRFAVAAQDASGRLVASGTITRVAVDRDRFLERF